MGFGRKSSSTSKTSGTSTKSSGSGSYPIGTPEEAQASLSAAKKALTPEEYAKLLAKACKKHPDLELCKKARNASMNETIRKGFGRNTAKSAPSGGGE